MPKNLIFHINDVYFMIKNSLTFNNDQESLKERTAEADQEIRNYLSRMWLLFSNQKETF